ncbi:uncharacterized protein LOC120837011 [Ixodes scapularis]|uniref:uncharacterized protein LOC120837011 n=1 Tax=Ixodes scapularis TaxID=6945 RepID=UPI001A9E8CF3|nr:uncharacterized protein LOC120837011 [Ixodes scapularis]
MEAGWVDDLKLWPKIQRSFIYEYMVDREDLDGKPANNHKGFAEALNLLDSGHVATIFVRGGSGSCQLRASVRSSQTVSKMYDTLISFEDNVILSIVCSCMAGLGQSCSHAGAILFKVAEATSSGLTGSSCTDVQCNWNASTVKNVVPSPLETICGHTPKKAAFLQFDSHAALQQHFMRSGFQGPGGSILSSVMEATLKPPPLQIFGGARAHGSHSADLSCQLCRKFYEKSVQLTAIQISSLGERTPSQGSSEWLQQRRLRITASTAGSIPKTASPENWIARRLNNTFRGNDSTRHGKLSEPKARAWYESERNCRVELCGMTVKEATPWLAASPDGFVPASDSLLEIKCPTDNVLNRHGGLTGLFSSRTYDVRYDGPKLMLSRDGKSSFYTQVQLQLFCLGKTHCDFVVWARGEGHIGVKGQAHIIGVPYDKEFVDKLLPKLETLYFEQYLPALVDSH